jgi:4-hydroxy-3-polyprenylbenzoate decarboxylase
VIQFHHATRRRQPVYVHTYIGVPPSDTHALGQMMGEAGLTAKLRNDVAPTVKEVYCALDMHTVVVALKKTYEEQAKHVIYALWATRSAKTVIVVDDDIDPRNQEEVYWAIANRSHAPRDVIMGDGFGTIGPATGKYGDTVGSKLGIDATAPLKGYPAMSRPRPQMAQRVRDRWAELTASQKPGCGAAGGADKSRTDLFGGLRFPLKRGSVWRAACAQPKKMRRNHDQVRVCEPDHRWRRGHGATEPTRKT